MFFYQTVHRNDKSIAVHWWSSLNSGGGSSTILWGGCQWITSGVAHQVFIIFLGRTFSGHNHDYIMLKQEFPPELDWFTDIHVGFDHGVGHSLLALCDAKAPRGQK